MGYQKNQSDFATGGIELLESKTLKSAALSNLSTNTIANLPASSSAILLDHYQTHHHFFQHL